MWEMNSSDIGRLNGSFEGFSATLDTTRSFLLKKRQGHPHLSAVEPLFHRNVLSVFRQKISKKDGQTKDGKKDCSHKIRFEVFFFQAVKFIVL